MTVNLTVLPALMASLKRLQGLGQSWAGLKLAGTGNVAIKAHLPERLNSLGKQKDFNLRSS